MKTQKTVRSPDQRKLDARIWAVASVRWALAMLFLLFGVGKLGDLKRFVAYYVLAPLEKSFLPKPLLLSFGYAMPFLEMLLGLLLFLGLFRNQALAGAIIYLLLILMGQALFTLSISETIFPLPPLLFNAFMYVVIAATLLFLDQYDRLVLWPPRGQPLSEEENGKKIHAD